MDLVIGVTTSRKDTMPRWERLWRAHYLNEDGI
jgi:hypothetical protein